MADRVLFLSWAGSKAGREEAALQAFNDAIGLYGRMQGEGRIEGFDIAILPPQGTIRGYTAVRGTAAQINDLREDREFQRIIMRAMMCVDELSVTAGYTGEGIATQIELYTEVMQGLPQPLAT